MVAQAFRGLATPLLSKFTFGKFNFALINYFVKPMFVLISILSFYRYNKLVMIFLLKPQRCFLTTLLMKGAAGTRLLSVGSPPNTLMKYGQHDLFLSASAYDRLNLYREIHRAEKRQLTNAQRIERQQHPTPAATDINLKRIALLVNRNYGSIYNLYSDLTSYLNEIQATETPDVDPFAIPEGQLRWWLVRQSLPYQFLTALLEERYTSLDALLAESEVSKATLLRHLRPLRDLGKVMGVRVVYETMQIKGDEPRIRLFLAIAFWLATDGYQWPFANLAAAQLDAAVRHITSTFEQYADTPVSREVAKYYLAVAYTRMQYQHWIDHTTIQDVLHYPVPNLYEDIRSLLAQMPEPKPILPPVTSEVGLSESTFVYFLLNFTPVYVTRDNQAITEQRKRFSRYNPAIVTLVTKFLDHLPIVSFDTSRWAQERQDMLVANLLGVTVSILTFHTDFGQTMAYALNTRMSRMPANPMFKQRVARTLESTIENENLMSFMPVLEPLAEAFYENLRMILTNLEPVARIKVAPLLEQTSLGYVDLISFLMAQPFIEVVDGYTPLSEVDIAIQAASLQPDEATGAPLYFKWTMDASSDTFGELYGILRELWLQKVQEEKH